MFNPLYKYVGININDTENINKLIEILITQIDTL